MIKKLYNPQNNKRKNNQITFCKNKKDSVIFTKDYSEVSILQDDGYLFKKKKNTKTAICIQSLSQNIITTYNFALMYIINFAISLMN